MMIYPIYRKIWEEFHNKKIPNGWHIHHIDGNHSNNNIENLYCCSKDEHWLLHFTQGDPIALNGKFIQGASEAGRKTKGIPKSEEHKLALRKPKKKGKIGKWIRTEKYRKEQSLRQKGKYIGENNPSKRPDVRKKISEAKMGNQCGIGNKSTKGMTWYYNGVKRIYKEKSSALAPKT